MELLKLRRFFCGSVYNDALVTNLTTCRGQCLTLTRVSKLQEPIKTQGALGPFPQIKFPHLTHYQTTKF